MRTEAHPGGEIRGQLLQRAIPEPGTLVLLAAVPAGLAGVRRRGR